MKDIIKKLKKVRVALEKLPYVYSFKLDTPVMEYIELSSLNRLEKIEVFEEVMEPTWLSDERYNSFILPEILRWKKEEMRKLKEDTKNAYGISILSDLSLKELARCESVSDAEKLFTKGLKW